MSDLDSSFVTAQTDLNKDLEATANEDGPVRVPFSETLRTLEHSSRKRKADTAKKLASDKSPICTRATAKNQREMAELIAPLISNQFSMDTATAISFKMQLTAYFVCIGIANESCLSMMSSYASWVPPTTFQTTSQKYDLITVPVMMMLAKLATYAVVFEQCNMHISKSATFDELTAEFLTRNEKTVSGSVTTHVTSTNAKIPDLSLPTFQGDTMNGDSYLDGITLAFKSAAMADFLYDEAHCDMHPTWSSAFSSKLRESLKTSPILNFLADEQDAEENCAKVFTAVEDHLTTGDVTMARSFKLWQELFKLKCDHRDDFLTFYSKSKGIIHRLKKTNSIAVTDEIFLKAYFSMAIDAPELQSEVKKFLKDPTSSYGTTLEAIHSDYRAQTTGEEMRLKAGSSSALPSALRRATVEVSGKHVPKTDYFPPNVKRLLPSSYYSQFKSWYQHFIIPMDQRTRVEKEWCDNFVFDSHIKESYAQRDHSNMNDRAEMPSGTSRFNQNRSSYRTSSSTSSNRHDYNRKRSEPSRSSRRARRSHSHSRSRSRSPERTRSNSSEDRHSRSYDSHKSSQRGGQRSSRRARREDSQSPTHDDRDNRSRSTTRNRSGMFGSNGGGRNHD